MRLDRKCAFPDLLLLPIPQLCKKTRNPKSETKKSQTPAYQGFVLDFGFRASSLFWISCFGFRVFLQCPCPLQGIALAPKAGNVIDPLVSGEGGSELRTKRIGPAAWLLLMLGGCSTAPVADIMDFFIPSRMPPDKTPPYGGVCNPHPGGPPGATATVPPPLPPGGTSPPVSVPGPPPSSSIIPPPVPPGSPPPPTPPYQVGME
jgi:hypothetical protein